MGISQGGQGRGTIFTEINITPLTDIFLVLLIIMMVIAPMFQETNKNIKVPTINSGQAVENNTVTVEVTKEGGFFVNGVNVQAEGLTPELQKWIGKVEEKHVIVRADETAKSSEVMKIFEASSAAGFEKMTIAGEPLSAARSRSLNNSLQKPEVIPVQDVEEVVE